MKIDFLLNGKTVTVEGDPHSRLIDVLHDRFGLTGCKEGCGEGECGACTVLMDQAPVPSCIIALGAVEGRQIVTIEGYAGTRRFKALSDAFAGAGAVQCGYCTPGMILAAEALLSRTPDPDEEQIREALAGNLCRCTGYDLIINAIKDAAARGRGLWGEK